MFTLSYTDKGELRRFRRELPKVARRVVVRVANDAVPVAKDSILRRWNVPAERVDRAFVVSQSNDGSWWSGTDNPKASIIARGRRIPLMDFGATQNATGVTFEVRKGTRQTIPHAFITQTLRGYGRKGGKSKKILRRVLKNLKRQQESELAASKARYASEVRDHMESAANWARRAERTSSRYNAATKVYQAQRALLTSMGAFRTGVFRRVGKKRLPIKALYGGSVQSFFASAEVTRELRKFCTVAIAEQMNAEVRSFFGGAT